MIDLRHLRYLIAVAEELNFTRAAQRLHMTQPPLSLAIRQLEQEVGAELFARSSREVRLTPAGQMMVEGARRALDGLEGTIQAARRASAGELGTLRVAFSWGARFATLPALARAFNERYPDVTLITEEMWNARMPQALRSAAIDLAVSVCPEIDHELTYEPIRRERVFALLPRGHRLAGLERITLNALASETFLVFPNELAPRLHDGMIALCRSAGFEPAISRRSFHSAGDTGALADLADVALVPESVARSLDGVASVPLDGPDGSLDTYLVWHPPTAPTATIAALTKIARNAFPAN
jgi:DNA-binding transcriptional LysR family regulator